MGSQSDWDVIAACGSAARCIRRRPRSPGRLGPPHAGRIVRLRQRRGGARTDRIIAGAGGAAHLPGMLAAKTTVPVLGVPIATRHLNGEDSLLSIVQMPKGVPVATFAIGDAGAANAALFAVAMLAAATPRWPARRVPQHANPGRGAMTLPPKLRRPVITPAPRSGCSVADSLGGCWCMAAQTMAITARARSRSRQPRRARSPPAPPRPLHRSKRSGDARGSGRSRHHRVRERDGPSLEYLGVAPGHAGRGRRRHRAGPDPRKALPRGQRLRVRAVRGHRKQADPLATDPALVPGIVKTARLGYDGKGQIRGDGEPRTGGLRGMAVARACLNAWSR